MMCCNWAASFTFADQVHHLRSSAKSKIHKRRPEILLLLFTGIERQLALLEIPPERLQYLRAVTGGSTQICYSHWS